MEALAERASALWHLGKEVCTNTPLSEETIKKHWYQARAEGSDHIDVELQSALLDKNDNFEPTWIPTIVRLLGEHLFNAPIKQSTAHGYPAGLPI